MQDRLKKITDKIELATSNSEKIDLQNKLAHELNQSDCEKSLKISMEVFKLSQQNNYTRGMAESLKNQANSYQTLSNFDLSFQKAIEALDLFRNLNDRAGEADIIYLLGRTSYILGDFENSLKYNLLCVQIRESINDILGVIRCYIFIGNIYSIKKDYDSALDHFLKGIELLEKTNRDENLEAMLFGSAGGIYASKREYEKALGFFDKALRLCQIDQNSLFVISTYNNVAETFMLMKDYGNAAKNYSSGFEAAVAMKNKLGESMSLLGLGKVAFEEGKTDDAVKCLQEALAIAESSLSRNTDTMSLKNILADTYLSLSHAMERKKDYSAALDYYKNFYNEKEHEFNEESDKKIRNLLILHQVESLKKESETQRLLNDNLKKLNEEIEDTHSRIMENIDYAKHIQESILPHPSSLKQYFTDSFAFFRPKDVISGDFLWLYEKENEILVAAVDCTGHGVSGAMMSIVANNSLNQVTAVQWMPNPSFILNEVNHYMQRTLAAYDEMGLRDSMDISMCSISKSKKELLFSGAHNSLFMISEGILSEYRGDSISIGNNASVKFTNHKLKIKKGDCIYLFTDGYVDQKGGSSRKKFYYQPFKDLLLRIYEQPMAIQKEELERVMNEWMGQEVQIDDMLIIGIRI